MAKEKRCCICGKPLNDKDKTGNNAMPFKKGYCCNECNKKYVLPSRMFSYELKNELITSIAILNEDIQSGKVELDPPNCMVVELKTNELKIPYKIRKWRKAFFNKLWKWDKNIEYERCRLIYTLNQKGIDDVVSLYYAEKGKYGFKVYYE